MLQNTSCGKIAPVLERLFEHSFGTSQLLVMTREGLKVLSINIIITEDQRGS